MLLESCHIQDRPAPQTTQHTLVTIPLSFIKETWYTLNIAVNGICWGWQLQKRRRWTGGPVCLLPSTPLLILPTSFMLHIPGFPPHAPYLSSLDSHHPLPISMCVTTLQQRCPVFTEAGGDLLIVRLLLECGVPSSSSSSACKLHT